MCILQLPAVFLTKTKLNRHKDTQSGYLNLPSSHPCNLPDSDKDVVYCSVSLGMLFFLFITWHTACLILGCDGMDEMVEWWIPLKFLSLK